MLPESPVRYVSDFVRLGFYFIFKTMFILECAIDPDQLYLRAFEK